MAERASGFFTRAVYVVAAAALAGVLAAWAATERSLAVALMAVAGAAALCLLAWLFGRIGREIRLADGWLALILAAICLIVKLAAVLRWRVEPSADYATFCTTAKDLAESGTISLHRYVALFPHIYGYSAFLSVFYRVFGSGELVAPIVNAGLSALTAALLYLLVRRYSDKKAGIFAAVLWTVCPSQTLYNIYVLSEPLYTAELAGALLLADSLRRRLKSPAPRQILRVAGLSAALGLLLAAVQLARPIAAIVLIVLAVAVLAIDLPYGAKGAALRVGALALASAVMLCATNLVGLRIDVALGEKRATSVGYSYAVGLNEASGGRWDASVSARLFEYGDEPGATADYAQSRMMDEVKTMIKSGKINYLSLFWDKYVNLLAHDHSAVTSYGKDVFIHQDEFADVCDAFYIGCVILAAVGAVLAIRQKERGALLMSSLFGVGLVAAQMLVEVAIRYHYSLYLAIIPLAVYVLQTISRKSERRNENGQLS